MTDDDQRPAAAAHHDQARHGAAEPDRRTLVRGGLAVTAALAGGSVLAAGGGLARARESAPEADVITVPGERPLRTNIPVARDPRAAGGAYLALATAEPPPAHGWFATYAVDVPAAGVHRLTAVATAPVEQPHAAEPGSYADLTAGDAPRRTLAGAQPHWYESPPAWGDLARLTLGDVELRRGRNLITFTVDQPTVLEDFTGYRFLLDEFTLTPTGLALCTVHLGDPAAGLGLWRGDGPAELHFGLGGRARQARTVTYTLLDYHSATVTSGTATVPAGAASATAPLPPDLPPGNYRVRAALDTAPADTVTGHFARLPERRPAAGRASRFGVNVATFALVPPARLDAFAAGMREMGAGWVRDGSSWPAAQRAPRGPYDSGLYGRTVRAFHRHGLQVLEVVSPPPAWAMTGTSVPLPADLRDAYRYAAHLAGRGNATVADALHLSNEPDVDDTASTGDQHAAYVKAAALGIAGRPHRPPVVLPGIATAGPFQDLMLQNDVARYADAWSFHGYPVPGEDPEFPAAAEEQRALRDTYGPGLPLWMTECGAMLPAEPGRDLTHERQLVQARYLVLSTVESLAEGTARHFWFCAPPCTDDGVSFALLDREFQPWPSYSAYAALTSLLGAADYVRTLTELLPAAAGFVFRDGPRTVTVVYAPGPGPADVPVPAGADGRAERYDIMGAHRGTHVRSAAGTVRVPAAPDPYYLVSQTPEAAAAPGPAVVRNRRAPLSAAEHIVLGQRFAAANAAPGKADGDAPPPLGYRLTATTRMSVDVYNFGDAIRTVAVTGRAFGGWSVAPAGTAEVTVGPMGRESVEFTVTAGPGVRRGVDYPLAFEAALAAGPDPLPVPPSVSRIQYATRRRPGRAVPLAPRVDRLSPKDGATAAGPGVRLRARVTDRLSGVGADGTEVEVDGRPVPHRFDPATGRLTASLVLRPGRHTVRIRARNAAHAAALATTTFTVREGA
ncbi:hypothetical protein [Streptomyces sp. NPDC004134]|uniref:hypothetical protein n=1 Tax=Streptomyces sp. NPDC004134 TaxID=3364691 RepID=UPI0036C0C3F9